jgi:hypothetical protein
VSPYAEALERHLRALDAHDTETRRMHHVAMETNTFPPAGTFPARENLRRDMSVRLEEAARGLLAEMGVRVMPEDAP